MKKRKILLIALGVVLAIYICFVAIDCIRLNTKNDVSKRPLIVVNAENEEDCLTYIGLGYSVEYKIRYDDFENSDGIKKVRNVYGAEFRLFNAIPLWSWTE